MTQPELKAEVVKGFMIFFLNFVILIAIGLSFGSSVYADKRKEILADLLALNVGLWVPSPLTLQGLYKNKGPAGTSDSD